MLQQVFKEPFYPHWSEVFYAIQSMALLTMFYDKPFQVSINPFATESLTLTNANNVIFWVMPVLFQHGTVILEWTAAATLYHGAVP